VDNIPVRYRPEWDEINTPLDPEPRTVGGAHVPPWLAPVSAARDTLADLIDQLQTEASAQGLTARVTLRGPRDTHPDPELAPIVEALDHGKQTWEFKTWLDSQLTILS
jgi:hypothetical protein